MSDDPFSVLSSAGEFIDQWGRAFVIHGIDPQIRPTVYSMGANGRDDARTGDDIVSDAETQKHGEQKRGHHSLFMSDDPFSVPRVSAFPHR